MMHSSPLVITNPDATTVQHRYGIANGLRSHTVGDANQHQTHSRTDALSWLVQMVEGSCTSAATWAAYATTNYSYSPLDLLDRHDRPRGQQCHNGLRQYRILQLSRMAEQRLICCAKVFCMLAKEHIMTLFPEVLSGPLSLSPLTVQTPLGKYRCGRYPQYRSLRHPACDNQPEFKWCRNGGALVNAPLSVYASLLPTGVPTGGVDDRE